MATFDELRLQELLSPFNNQGNNTGITSINQDYTDPRYTYDGLYQENYGDYDERMNPDRSPYGNVYGTNSAQASKSSAFPLNFYGSESTFAPRIGLPNQVPQNLAFLPNQVPQINSQVPQINNQVNNQVPFNDFYGSVYEPYDEEKDNEQVDYLPGQKKKLSDMGRNFGISSLIGMITGNPIIGLLSKGMGALTGGSSFVGPKGSTGYGNDSAMSLFKRSNNFKDFFQSMRDKKARNDAAARGAAKANMADARSITNRISSAPVSNQDRGRGGGGGGGTGSAGRGGASPGSAGPGGSDSVGSF